MRNQHLSGVYLICIFFNCAGAAETVASNSGPTQEEREIVTLTNQQREQHGLQPLAINPQLTGSARGHARAMALARTLAHTLNGSAMTQRIKDAGYPYLGIGENIAFNQGSPEDVVTAWMNSPGHRANILNKNFTEIGAGVARDADGEPYYAQDFGRPLSAGPTESASFKITNHTHSTATIVLPGSPGASQLDPGSTGEFTVSGIGQLPPVKISVGEQTKTLGFQDGAAYILRPAAGGIEIQGE